MLFGQVAALADLHRHAATRARITIPGNDYGAITLSLFLVQHGAPPQPIRAHVSHSIRTALAADALALQLGPPNYCARMKSAYPTSNNSRSMTRQMMNQANSIVTSVCT